jgi:hypothetical protein
MTGAIVVGGAHGDAAVDPERPQPWGRDGH